MTFAVVAFQSSQHANPKTRVRTPNLARWLLEFGVGGFGGY